MPRVIDAKRKNKFYGLEVITVKLVKCVTLLSLIMMVGCAHTTMRGTVAMKVNKREAHVCLGDNEVKAGDKVALFTNECGGAVGREGVISCKKVKIGGGQVLRTLNSHYSLIRVDSGVKFKEGTIVEKL